MTVTCDIQSHMQLITWIIFNSHCNKPLQWWCQYFFWIFVKYHKNTPSEDVWRCMVLVTCDVQSIVCLCGMTIFHHLLQHSGLICDIFFFKFFVFEFNLRSFCDYVVCPMTVTYDLECHCDCHKMTFLVASGKWTGE